MANLRCTHPPATATQSGAVLPVGLMVLATMMVVGLASLRQATLGARMTSHASSRSLSLQAADAALREIESRLLAIKPEPLTGPCSDHVAGQVSVRACPAPTSGAPPRWLDAGFNGWVLLNGGQAGGKGPASSYFSEYLGNTFPCGPITGTQATCRRYRVTVRTGNGIQAQVTLQSIYATQ